MNTIFPQHKIIKSLFFFVLIIFVGFSNSNSPQKAGPKRSEEKGFKKYWYSQGAEISKFKLEQSRYGEIHEGDAVLVFVTEPMNPVLQVKSDHKAKNNVPVLKLNSTRKFYTGVYPYSIMTSIFSPINGNDNNPLKVTTSVQEWCGQVFFQLNRKKDHLSIQSRSYFEKESDLDYKHPLILTEEGVWTQIRIDPSKLPTGSINIIPSSVYTRLSHTPYSKRTAEAKFVESKEKSLEGNPLAGYQIHYKKENRTITIYYEREFPHRIQSWEEKRVPVFGSKDRLTTKATRTHIQYLPYWSKHKNKDRALLSKLGLSPTNP